MHSLQTVLISIIVFTFYLAFLPESLCCLLHCLKALSVSSLGFCSACPSGVPALGCSSAAAAITAGFAGMNCFVFSMIKLHMM